MKPWLLLIGLAALAAGAVPVPAAARQAPTCDRLWYSRTAIYARAGKCFKDERALRVFGQKCFRPYGKLTVRDQRRMNDIARQERRLGCETQ